jgi:Big-like domain-containing protein/uncharacterized protein DUF1565
MLHRRPARPRSRILLGIGLTVAVLTGLTGLWATANAAGAAYFVSPTGADTNPGTSAAAPFKTVQKALDLAAAGSTITLAPGVYRESIVTKTAGTAASPITIKGPETGKNAGGRYRAVLAGKGSGGYVVAISHSNYVLDGFTVDGQPSIDRSEYPTSLSAARGFKDSVQSRAINTKLVYVGADVASRDITGTRIANMFLSGAGGECVRFRNRAAASLVVNSVIQWCGMLASGDDSSKYKYHNSEGVYVGTSPKSTDQPLYANDTSNGIVVRNSTINTFGGECFDVKENAHHNRIEDSDCGFNDEPLAFKGSNIEFRGDHNLVRRTKVHDSRSWNVKLASDSAQYDKGGNSIQQSNFSGATGAAIRSEQSTADSTYCANTFAATPYVEGPVAIGDPRQPCSGIDTTLPTAAITSPANGATVAGTVPITVDAADNAAVTRVEFVVDGAPVGTDTAAPWSQSWTVPSAPGPHTITATAYDAADNAATAEVAVSGGTTTPPTSTSAVVTTTPAPTPQTIAFEAESGTLTSPMSLASSNSAQGGRYVVQASGSGTGRVTYRVSVPVGASYVLAYRAIAPSTSSDEFTYAVDGGSTRVLTVPSSARTNWTWVNGPTLNLSAGAHTLVVAKRENGVRLDAFTLTPPGAATAPSPTTTPTTPTTAPVPRATPTSTPPAATTTTPPPTTTTTTTAPPPVPVATTPFEAETGTVSTGMAVVADATASGGSSVVARSAGGTVRYTVSVPSRGTYMIAGWVKAPSSSADAFTVRLDSGSSAEWRLTQSRSWTYDAGSNPSFSLSAGTHTLTVGYREAGAAVDRLVLVRR